MVIKEVLAQFRVAAPCRVPRLQARACVLSLSAGGAVRKVRKRVGSLRVSLWLTLHDDDG